MHTLGRTTQSLALVTYAAQPAARASQSLALIVYPPAETRQARTAQSVALIPYTTGKFAVPRTSQSLALIVYTTGVPEQSRSRAWTYTMDGHVFYVLDLGDEGTFAYDATTKEWAQFDTEGFGRWNMVVGTMWGNRVVAGDIIASQVWELVPTAVKDEDWRDIEHVATGAVQTRSRVFHTCDSVRVAASVGQIDDVNGASLTLRFSDDNGKTWSDDYSVDIVEGDYSAEIAFRSLGAFASPGRIFELSDTGGLLRIDGADAYIDGFDNDGEES